MVQNTGTDWESFNTGLVAPVMNYATIGQIATAATAGTMPNGTVRTALYGKVKSPGNSNTSKIGFRVYAAAGFKGSGLTGGEQLYCDAVSKHKGGGSKGKAETCAEHHMYKEIASQLAKKSYVVVTQDFAPCRQCIASYAGLAKAKELAILVYFEQTYDIMTAAPGVLLFTDAGAAYHFG